MLAACSEEIQSAQTLTELNYQNYLYGGKELDRKFGINAYDFTGRYYDLTDNRFWSMDPMAEDYYDVSPYAYGLNNPLRYNDPTGMAPSDTINGGRLKEVNVVADFFKNGLALALYSTSILGSQFNRVFGIENASFSDNVAAGFNFHTFALMPLSLLKPKHFGTNTRSITELNNNSNAVKEVDVLLKAGNNLDRGGLTVVGRALQKHSSRAGSVFPKAIGNPAAINAQGEVVLKGIITNPNAVSVIRHHARFGNVLEYKIPGGQGARFSSDGKTFIGFIEL